MQQPKQRVRLALDVRRGDIQRAGMNLEGIANDRFGKRGVFQEAVFDPCIEHPTASSQQLHQTGDGGIGPSTHAQPNIAGRHRDFGVVVFDETKKFRLVPIRTAAEIRIEAKCASAPAFAGFGFQRAGRYRRGVQQGRSRSRTRLTSRSSGPAGAGR